MSSNTTFAIFSNNILTPTGFKSGYLVVENEKFLGVSDSKPDCFIEDFSESYVMPGIVDCHVHINEPGRTEWEGFETATKAAVSGGITTLIDMPLNCSPVTTSLDALKIKLKEVKNKLWADCGFWGGVIPNNIEKFTELVESGGILGAKAFLIDSGIEEFPNVTEKDLLESMPILKKHSLPLITHAEIESFAGQTSNYNNPTSYQAFLDSRPKEIENNAVKLMIDLCKKTDCKTHIVHLSSADVLEEVRSAKKSNIPFSVETCPHYLFFNAEEIDDGDTKYKCCPPIREKSNNDKLWSGLKDGTIDFIVSDHSPCTANLKLMEKGDIEHAWGGIAGLQFSFSAVWTEAQKRGFTLEDITKLMSQNTSKLIGLDNVKGKIEKGFDADFFIFNPDVSFKVEENLIHHKNKVTPYLNKEFKGKILKTYIRGKTVYNNGIFSDNPEGKFLLKGKNIIVD